MSGLPCLPQWERIYLALLGLDVPEWVGTFSEEKGRGELGCNVRAELGGGCGEDVK